MGALTFAAMGAAEGLGRGLANVGAAQMQAIQQEEAERRRVAEWDRQQQERLRLYEQRTLIRDEIGDENWAERHAGGGGALSAARGGRSAGGGGGAGAPEALFTGKPEDAAARMAAVNGMPYQDALAYIETVRGARQRDLAIVDDEHGPQVIKGGGNAVVGDALRDGATKFQRAFFMLGGKGPEQIAEAEVIQRTGRKPSNLTDEQIEADVAARRALADQRVAAGAKSQADARKADRTPAKGAGGGGGSNAPKTDPQAKADTLLMESLRKRIKDLLGSYDKDDKALRLDLQRQLDEVTKRVSARATGAAPGAAPGAAGTPAAPDRPRIRIISAEPLGGR